MWSVEVWGGKSWARYVGCGWYERGAAYYAVNTVHIGTTAAGEGITTNPFPTQPSCAISPPLNPSSLLIYASAAAGTSTTISGLPNVKLFT